MAEPYALLAEFDSPERLMDAARRLREQGWRRLEAFTPFPVEGLDRLLGFTDDKVARAMLIGGAAGAVLGFLMQVGTNLDYPLWVGGRPLIAVPAFMLICFEMLVLGAVLSGIGTLFVANRLPRLNHPVFAADRFDLSADDRFFLAILADADFDRDDAGKALAALGPRAIIEVSA
ncbi:membrane protein [Sphingobium sp. C100]|uniref:DUF3341 domain-containing protein n=1 Tax=Sphingobium sp. C100 TaxID=1207055 RepID=UPI0003D5C313|nr:DUF3341 domain-containing protein [Sphingobium sp. C100]ETI65741.1 membrane protein [Sphingobium sp. C100]